FAALRAPKRLVRLELALEAREFLTWPSVEAARLSLTTIETTSCRRTALASVPSRTRRPSELQIDPVVLISAACWARTRSMYARNAASGGVVLSGAIIFLRLAT